MKPIFNKDPVIDQIMDLIYAFREENMELAAIELTVPEAAELAQTLTHTAGFPVPLSVEDINGSEFNGVELRVEDF